MILIPTSLESEDAGKVRNKIKEDKRLSLNDEDWQERPCLQSFLRLNYLEMGAGFLLQHPSQVSGREGRQETGYRSLILRTSLHWPQSDLEQSRGFCD